MDFSDTPEEAGFRGEARAFLQKNAEPRGGMFETWESRYGEAEALRRAKDFQRRKAEAGLAGITWPKEYGGGGGAPGPPPLLWPGGGPFSVPRRGLRDGPRAVLPPPV